MTKEKIYDEQINPLMGKIIDICREHKIAMLADFAIGEDLKCTSALLADEFSPGEGQLDAYEILKPKKPIMFAETTETMENGSKRITIRRIT
jgi:hypothetical protein